MELTLNISAIVAIIGALTVLTNIIVCLLYTSDAADEL